MRAVKVPRPVRPHPVVWIDERVAQWKRTGVRPPVAVWTLPQLVRFLDAVKDDRLAGVWWLIALRGLRRGEATGLRRGDLDGQARELAVHRQVVALPGALYYGPPKSRAGNRTVALDRECVARLRQQLTRQATDLREHRYVKQARHDARARLGVPRDTDDRDTLFTYADGRPIRPEYLSHRFRTLVKQLGLPPIRLHDLRHGVAARLLDQIGSVAGHFAQDAHDGGGASLGQGALSGSCRDDMWLDLWRHVVDHNVERDRTLEQRYARYFVPSGEAGYPDAAGQRPDRDRLDGVTLSR
jgi:integrase